MELTIWSLGFFSYLSSRIESKDSSYINEKSIQAYFKDKCFEFDIEIHREQNDHIEQHHCLFDPAQISTRFNYSSLHKELPRSKILIKRQPDFFAFVIPFPNIEYKVPNSKNWRQTSSDWVFPNYDFAIEEKKLWEPFLYSPQINNEYRINQNIDNSIINNFMANKSYPLFIKTNQELFSLIDGYKDFMEKKLKISLSINSFSKIVIPFFEITKKEIKIIADSEINTINKLIDDLPF